MDVCTTIVDYLRNFVLHTTIHGLHTSFRPNIERNRTDTIIRS